MKEQKTYETNGISMIHLLFCILFWIKKQQSENSRKMIPAFIVHKRNDYGLLSAIQTQEKTLQRTWILKLNHFVISFLHYFAIAAVFVSLHIFWLSFGLIVVLLILFCWQKSSLDSRLM